MDVKFVLKNFSVKCRLFLFQLLKLFQLLFLVSKTQPNSLCAYKNKDQTYSYCTVNNILTVNFDIILKNYEFKTHVYFNGFRIYFEALYFLTSSISVFHTGRN